jgi:hypothetical protein
VRTYRDLTDEQRKARRQAVTDWQRRNPAKYSDYVKRAYWHAKTTAIQILGGRCVGCGEDNVLVLSINHINGQAGIRDSRLLYRDIIAGRATPAEVDVRCLNCQLLYDYERGVRKLPEGAEFAGLREVESALRRI